MDTNFDATALTLYLQHIVVIIIDKGGEGAIMTTEFTESIV